VGKKNEQTQKAVEGRGDNVNAINRLYINLLEKEKLVGLNHCLTRLRD